MEYDPFQKKAIEEIEKGHSLIVSAPTGAGKTVIAEYVIEKSLTRGEEVIYTAPVKALSNQKFRDFEGRYPGQVGILTGDVSLHPEAPVLIMTTEIYRNSLFENPKRFDHTQWVIFDEVHYLDDIERGTVWEEAMIFSPPHLKLLALSATCPNIDELAAWIRGPLGRSVSVVTEKNRPVPLHFYYQCQGKIYEPFEDLRRWGYEGRDHWSFRRRDQRHGLRPLKARPNRLDTLLHHLLSQDRLPTIYFTFGRRRAEALGFEVLHLKFLKGEEPEKLLALYHELLKRYDLERERSAQELLPLIERGIAYHHAGMLPTLKEVVERLFTSRLIKLIFTTETFALGINMPARTVIFDELRKFYGTHFANLRTRDFYQMAGRAGRRGIDREGFVYARVNPHDIPYPEVVRMVQGKTEAVESQFNTAYATLLNLYRKHGQHLFEIYPLSLHHFQSSQRERKEGLDLMQRKLNLLDSMNYLSKTSSPLAGDPTNFPLPRWGRIGGGESQSHPPSPLRSRGFATAQQGLPPPIKEGERKLEPEADQQLTEKGEFASWMFGYELLMGEMFEDGFLESLEELDLSVALAALVFEPRKGDRGIHPSKRWRWLERKLDRYREKIHREETRHRIWPGTKSPNFRLAQAVEAWQKGTDFEKLYRLSEVDEGEMVRYLRMVLQLLRQLLRAPMVSEAVAHRAASAIHKINRGVVDAEKQLRA